MTTHPAAQAATEGESLLRKRFAEWEYGAEWNAALDEVIAYERRHIEALADALRALVEAVTAERRSNHPPAHSHATYLAMVAGEAALAKVAAP